MFWWLSSVYRDPPPPILKNLSFEITDDKIRALSRSGKAVVWLLRESLNEYLGVFNVKVVALFNKARKFENLMLLNLSSSFVFVQLFFNCLRGFSSQQLDNIKEPALPDSSICV